jgi:hypothetical protein
MEKFNSIKNEYSSLKKVTFTTVKVGSLSYSYNSVVYPTIKVGNVSYSNDSLTYNTIDELVEKVCNIYYYKSKPQLLKKWLSRPKIEDPSDFIKYLISAYERKACYPIAFPVYIGTIDNFKTFLSSNNAKNYLSFPSNFKNGSPYNFMKNHGTLNGKLLGALIEGEYDALVECYINIMDKTILTSYRINNEVLTMAVLKRMSNIVKLINSFGVEPDFESLCLYSPDEINHNIAWYKFTTNQNNTSDNELDDYTYKLKIQYIYYNTNLDNINEYELMLNEELFKYWNTKGVDYPEISNLKNKDTEGLCHLKITNFKDWFLHLDRLKSIKDPNFVLE